MQWTAWRAGWGEAPARKVPTCVPTARRGNKGSAPRLSQPAWRAGFPSGLCKGICAEWLRHIGRGRIGR